MEGQQENLIGMTCSSDPTPARGDDDEDEFEVVRDEQAEDVIMEATVEEWSKEDRRKRRSNGQNRVNNELSGRGVGDRVIQTYSPPE